MVNEVPVVMPKMSMTMTEGTFLVWHKSPGDQIHEGDVVCEVATDKVDMEVEATVAGTLTRLLAEPEDVVEVGEPLAYIATEAEELLGGLFDTPPLLEASTAEAEPIGRVAEVAALAPKVPAEASVPEGRAESPPPTPVASQAVTGVPAAVPAARRLAAERGIDLATVTATGPWGTIRLSDVDSTTNGRKSVNRGRAAVARRMVASAQVPQFVLYRDLDLESVERTHGWTVLLTRAFAAALRRHPELNASWTDGAVQRHDHVGVALAVDTPRGLLAPVLSDPDHSDLDTLAGRISDMVARARAGRLGLAELSAPATTTLSNLGGFGVTGFQALLTPPQATALAVGAIEPKVVPVPGGLGVRLRCTVGLSVDHRVGDGADGARLLATLQELL